MSFTPTYAVIDAKVLMPNLLAYIEANQREALNYVGGEHLSVFKKFYSSAIGRLGSVYPHLMVIKAALGEQSEDHVNGIFEFTLAGEIVAKNADVAIESAYFYEEAVRTMLREIPGSAITQNSRIPVTAFMLAPMDVEYDEIALPITGKATSFMQGFKTTGRIALTTSPLN